MIPHRGRPSRSGHPAVTPRPRFRIRIRLPVAGTAAAVQDLHGGNMKTINLLGISVLAVALTSSAAFAKTDAGSRPVSPLPKAGALADNVVVTPNGQTAPAPAPAPAPTSVNVQPAPQPVEAAPVVAPTQRTVVTEDKPHNYMATIAVS